VEPRPRQGPPDPILTNRRTADLVDVSDEVGTRDLFTRD